ncbi:hypothetical protein KAR91_34255 [Candidatus Pacearchaeota archaeon]|nr:hypothetical protein [Candidatus Pacearchaeota archaeon]
MKTYKSLSTDEQIMIDVAYEAAMLNIEKTLLVLYKKTVDTRDQDNSKEAAGILEALAVFYKEHMTV